MIGAQSNLVHLSPTSWARTVLGQFPSLGFTVAWGYYSVRQLRWLVDWDILE
jgi:hypothetical protein